MLNQRSAFQRWHESLPKPLYRLVKVTAFMLICISPIIGAIAVTQLGHAIGAYDPPKPTCVNTSHGRVCGYLDND
jgi:hypothetical protein